MDPKLFLPLVPAAMRPVAAALLHRLETAEQRAETAEREGAETRRVFLKATTALMERIQKTEKRLAELEMFQATMPAPL